jgi:adenosylcobyric acid synthase
MTARAIFVGGTSSNAGKSWMATAMCAWLRQRGVSVAPFKAQNMSNNSYPCRDGGEIGRAQVAQAEACELAPEVAMNPILLKPNGDGTSQVVVNGRVWKTLLPREYYAQFDHLRRQVRSAYQDLARRFDVVVIEGAGSVSEINLRQFDLVNLRLATDVGAPWVLVADIERGGVFASILGTMSLLTAEERRLFRGFMINKFRGELSLFDEGVEILEQRTGSPCLGVFPFADNLEIDPEDSLAWDGRPRDPAPDGARIGIIRPPRISNVTDFHLLTWADWLTAPPARDYDFVILPGSKNTIADLRWMRERGLDTWIVGQRNRGASIVGICGGFQMLGRAIHDPHAIESSESSAHGLGLVPAETVIQPEKTTRVVSARTSGGVSFNGYEIHLGRTTLDIPLRPFATMADGTVEGVCQDGILGTYLHGALESAPVCTEVFRVRVQPRQSLNVRNRRLAEWFDRHVRSIEALGLQREGRIA